MMNSIKLLQLQGLCVVYVGSLSHCHAIINSVNNNTCVLPAMTSQKVCCEKGHNYGTITG